MIGLRTLFAIALAAFSLNAQDARLRVETVVDEPRPFVGQIVTVRVLLYVEIGFQNENLVQAFRQQLGLPLQVSAPWAESPESPESGVTLAWNGRRTEAKAIGEVQKGDLAFRVYRVAQRLRATAEPQTLASPRVTAIYAEEFREDFLEGRVPVKRLELVVSGNEIRLTPRALPDPGDRPDFAGAIGRFEVSWSLDRDTLSFGESVRATLRVTGDGDLENLRLPSPRGLDGFQILGRIEERTAEAIEITFDLAPKYALDRGPDFALETFDPDEGSFRTVLAEGPPLRVRDAPPAPEPGESEARAPIPGVDTIHRIDPARAPDSQPGRAVARPSMWLLGLTGLVVAAGIFWFERRRERRRPEWRIVRRIDSLHRALDQAFENDPKSAPEHLRALISESFDPPYDHPAYRALEVRLDALRFDPSGPEAPSANELRIQLMDALVGLSAREDDA